MKSEERKQLAKEQRKGFIIESSEKLILEKGIEHVTVEEIAQLAGYNKRTIYLYFEDKHEIFLAIVFKAQIEFCERLQRAYESSENNSKLINLGWAFYDYAMSHPSYFKALMTYESNMHQYYGDTTNTSISEYQKKCYDASIDYGHITIKAIEDDLKNNIIQSRLKPVQLMVILWGQIVGIMQLIIMRSEKFKETYGIGAKKLFEEFLTITSRGLQA